MDFVEFLYKATVKWDIAPTSRGTMIADFIESHFKTSDSSLQYAIFSVL